jgi:hypothetical protein
MFAAGTLRWQHWDDRRSVPLPEIGPDPFAAAFAALPAADDFPLTTDDDDIEGEPNSLSQASAMLAAHAGTGLDLYHAWSSLAYDSAEAVGW